ncbi:MAG TPA: TonB-dependent receptor, partial [Chryseolinea sp.]|nr:TonB-dependent receptor [Chryseolinea sp.]
VNKGKGRNYGIEFSIEKEFSNSFYYLFNTSLYESKFTVDKLPERNTSYNGNYSFHGLAGKEFDINRGRDRLGINVKFTTAGGRPFVPIDLQKSIAEERTVYVWEQAFEQKLPDYFRADFQVVYKKNNPRYSTEWRLDLQNFTDHRNAAYYYFDQHDGTIRLKKQIGFLPLLSFRIDF